MGYTTDFTGEFTLNKPLDATTKTYLHKFNETRRMKRKLPPQFGVEGEFYVEGTGMAGQDRTPDIIDYNSPPSTQPGLWCGWCPNEQGTAIIWDGGEKFYYYEEWLNYLIANFLAPAGYVLNGTMEYQGEDSDDFGLLRVVNNEVKRIYGTKNFKEEEPAELPTLFYGTYSMDARDNKIFMAMLSNVKTFLIEADKKAFTNDCKKHAIRISMGEV